MICWLFAAVVASGAIAACTNSSGHGGTTSAAVFGPPAFAGGRMDKGVGEDCSAGGGGACKSGLCLHFQPNASTGFLCSQRCRVDSECPRGWRCLSLYPSPGSEFCAPPGNSAAQTTGTQK